MNFLNWSSLHQKKSVLGLQISYIDTGDFEKETILIIPGYGSSSFDYHKIINDLKENYRVIIPDLVGFGLSSKPTKFYFSMVNQSEVLINLLIALKVDKLSIITQGFGSSIMCEVLNVIENNSINIHVKNIFLLNVSLYIEANLNIEKQEEFSKLVSSIFLKMSNSYEMFKKYYLQHFYDPTSVSEEELVTSWELLKHNDGLKTFNFASYWSSEIQNSSLRWLKVLKNLNADVYFVLGEYNKYSEFAELENTKKILKAKDTYTIPECGYFVSLEKPKELVEIIKRIIV
jgi:pimeloyl-ACP methyl ester carboxylesterase